MRDFLIRCIHTLIRFDFHNDFDVCEYLFDFKIFEERKNDKQFYAKIVEKVDEDLMYFRNHIQRFTSRFIIEFKYCEIMTLRTKDIVYDFNKVIDFAIFTFNLVHRYKNLFELYHLKRMSLK